MSIGLCCDTCDEACRVRLNVRMSDARPFDTSGVTFTAVIKQGGTTVATVGPLSPSLSAYQEIIDLLASTAYTVELTVEQDGGTTCTFNRSFTTPAVCNPFSFSLFIPRVWVKFYDCHTQYRDCPPQYPCEMDINVSGPGGFAYSGNTGPVPLAYDDANCYLKFTPCAPGDYTFDGVSTVPNTNSPTATEAVAWASGAVATELPYWQKWPYGLFEGSVAHNVHPLPGYVWPWICAAPMPTTLHLTTGKHGSCALTSDKDGLCLTSVSGDAKWLGTGTGSLPSCDGGDVPVTISWTLTIEGSASAGWRWVLLGTYGSQVCACPEVDAYGRIACVAKIGAGVAGSIVGSAAVEACEDCAALSLSFALPGMKTNTLCSPYLPGSTICSSYASAFDDSATITI